MPEAPPLSKSVIAKFVDDFILSFETVQLSDKEPHSHLRLALGIATKSLNVESSAIFHFDNRNKWLPILHVKVDPHVTPKCGDKISEIPPETCTLPHHITARLNNISTGETFTNTPQDNKNTTLIPFQSGTTRYCIVFFNKNAPIVENSDVYYLQQHYRLFKAFFEFASSGSASIMQLWRDSLFAGSRSSILERSNDFIKTFSKTPNLNPFDFITATGIDASLQIRINPRNQTTLKTNSDIEDITLSQYSPPYMKLALIRRDIWQHFEEKKISRLCIENARAALNQTHSTPTQISKSRQPKPHFENSTLDASMSKKLMSFLFDNYYQIELAKTHLFLLHYLTSSQEDAIDTEHIKEADKLFNDKFNTFNIHERLTVVLQKYLNEWAEASRPTLIITSEWLVFWFGLKMLSSKKLFKKIETRYPPDFRAKFYRHFSCYYLYTLFLIRCLGEPSLFRFSDVPGGFEAFINSSLFLMAEFAHHEEDLDITIPLHTALQDIWSKEAILYSVRDGYRDHFHHVWNVCLLGLTLIDAGILKRIDPHWNSYTEEHRKNIRRNWILAGLLHDIGYSLDLNRHMANHLEIFAKIPGILVFSKNLSAFLKEAEKNLCTDMSVHYDFFDGKNLDHGITSAIYISHLDKLSIKTTHTPSETWTSSVSLAIEAVAKHNIKGTPIDPSKSPLTFLLLLCDHLQEWDRPRLDGNKLRRSFSIQFHRPRQGQSVGHDIVRRLETDLEWADSAIKIKEEHIALNLVYKDAAKKNFEPPMIWCQNTVDFQAIELGLFPKDFKIIFSSIHPLSSKITRLSRTEMQLFEDFCRQDDSRLHLVDWCNKSQNGMNCYQLTANGEEIYTWTFQKCQTLGKIKHMPTGLYRSFSQWKSDTIRTLQIAKANCTKR